MYNIFIMKKLLLYLLFIAVTPFVYSQINNRNVIYPQIWEQYSVENSEEKQQKQKIHREYTIPNNKIKYLSVIMVYENTDTTESECLWELRQGENRVISAGNKNEYYYEKESKNDTLETVYFNHKLPMIQSTIYPLAKKFKDSLTFSIGAGKLRETTKYGGKIYECLFFPTKISMLQRQQIETYLALKYGISLQGEDYISPSGKVLWSYESNKSYSNAIMGIGADSTWGLYQERGNSVETDFMTIEVDSIYKRDSLIAETYLILGQNREDLNISEKSEQIFLQNSVDSFFRINRRWYVQNRGFKGTTSVIIKGDSLPNIDTCYLLIEDGEETERIVYQSIKNKDNYFVFSQIEWESDTIGRILSLAVKRNKLLEEEQIAKKNKTKKNKIKENEEIELNSAESSEDSCNIYPTPTEEMLYVEISDLGLKEIEIYNIEGKKYLSKVYSGQKFSIDVSELVVGNYILKIQTDNKLYVKKFTKK